MGLARGLPQVEAMFEMLHVCLQAFSSRVWGRASALHCHRGRFRRMVTQNGARSGRRVVDVRWGKVWLRPRFCLGVDVPSLLCLLPFAESQPPVADSCSFSCFLRLADHPGTIADTSLANFHAAQPISQTELEVDLPLPSAFSTQSRQTQAMGGSACLLLRH